MDRNRYQRLQLALSLSLFIGCLTGRDSSTLVTGLAAFFGFLVFTSLVLFIVSSSSTMYEAIAAGLTGRTQLFLTPEPTRRLAPSVVRVHRSCTAVALPFRFQLPPPTL